jgi:hypothetical protein
MMVYVASLLVLAFLATTTSTALSTIPPRNSGVSPQSVVTDEEWKEIRDNTSTIITPFGEFERVPSALPFHPPEVVYNTVDVTAKTKQIIEYGGVFVRK